MGQKMLAVLIVGLLVAADDVKSDSKQDMEKMQGEWTMVSGSRDGQPIPDEFVQSLRRTISGDKFSVKREGESLSAGTFKLDASKTPKTIDLTLTEGQASGQTIQGIYELQGDTLKICYSAPGQPRPKEFSAAEGSMQTFATWKRAKK
jgi:uncharacterized protein (TIGR03067 family)